VKIDEVDLAVLRNSLAYDPASGEFTWKARPFKTKVVIGARAGSENPRTHYRAIGLAGQVYNEHHLAWLYHYGSPPAQQIDHANGDTTDNRIANLRLASASQNNANRRRHKSNHSGFKGVDLNRGRWRAMAKKDGKQHYFGLHDTAEQAHAAYVGGIARLHGEFARAG
jgi:hypothetical protein